MKINQSRQKERKKERKSQAAEREKETSVRSGRENEEETEKRRWCPVTVLLLFQIANVFIRVALLFSSGRRSVRRHVAIDWPRIDIKHRDFPILFEIHAHRWNRED